MTTLLMHNDADELLAQVEVPDDALPGDFAAKMLAAVASADPPTTVTEALAAVMRELPGIGKDQASEQGYNYRGIEAITSHAQQLFGKYGVVYAPRVLSRDVKDFQINNRPWTEEHQVIEYDVYGPSHGKWVTRVLPRFNEPGQVIGAVEVDVMIDDHMTVGPLHALGRDNSDKGSNKCMTAAFKYALLQTLCIGDHKDDTDAEEAHQADAPGPPVDEGKALRVEMGKHLQTLTPEQRDSMRAFCDENGISRVPAQWSDEDVERVNERLDALAIEAAQDAAATESQLPPSERSAAPSGDVGPLRTTPALDLSLDRTEPPLQRPSLETVIVQVQALSDNEVNNMLKERGMAQRGNMDTKRKRLAEDLYNAGPDASASQA